MKTLIVNAHPNYENRDTYSSKLQSLFLNQVNRLHPSSEINIINLYEIEIPKLNTKQLFNIWNKDNNQELLNENEQRLFKIWKGLISQFKDHHRIVIVMPMHNFNITSKLKDYMDNILIARETFKYTKDGSVGLMDDDYKALLLQSSGSVYTNNDRYTALEFSYSYLKAMFEEIMAFNHFDIVRAEGTAILSEETIMNNATIDLNNKLELFYHTEI
ncbi:NAD(P)H-dependent oxidoreductase [Staphylococcus sp. ACRSN]|uniref:FMN-dependent NADH-azoreductase n=1 Tax=Staphylococcus sp. ACRSN TaxID=2918214 RepID=UPI001EF224FF|nr:NAD(P)H-dependent oxidoreductase [Staphylococcus sp. ACRSN]MCG7338358.1 NAD(P)H-dependent oxidoreductase [Staphylococcus sp. ACRSN]